MFSRCDQGRRLSSSSPVIHFFPVELRESSTA
ncbi:hypothetical protein M6B38_153270 [Iris pallida]|uniref:Uncharacterized protein n=1 Tax=Iris pallida TaxID=29817 RepID=A0AAX6ESW9_IRIPA|nr:hypothetical protein M6B38_173260 [Iris pallida]KAJ6811559.1 hypothetical protein M6B38_153270 [Iris pallida]